VLTPRYAEQLAHPLVAAVARSMLDSHVRVAMQNDRIIPSGVDTPNGEPGGVRAGRRAGGFALLSRP
jgi:hypothetical protein